MILELYSMDKLEKSGEIAVADSGQVSFVRGSRAVRRLAEEYKNGFETDGTDWDENGNPGSVYAVARPSEDTFECDVNLLASEFGLCTADKATRLRLQRSA